jgi:hypothetical protein
MRELWAPSHTNLPQRPTSWPAAVYRRDEADVTHFLTVSRWANEEAIRAFTGGELLKARYYPEDTGYLIEFEPEVQHFRVVGRSP